MPHELRGQYTFRELRNQYDVDAETRPQQIQLTLADTMLSVAESNMDEGMKYAALGQLASVMAGLNQKWTGGTQRSFHFTERTVQFD
jgi:uncharacterized protein YukE